MSLRSFVRNLKLDAVRALQRLALTISSPFDFWSQIVLRMRDPDMRCYLAENGANQILEGLYSAALVDRALHRSLIKSEVGNVFRALYLPSVNDPVLAPY